MIVFLNGQFVPEAEAKVSVFDRSFLYGDGLFESVRVYAGKPFRWPQHLERLHAGAKFLGIRLPFSDAELTAAATGLLTRNALPEATLRLVLSRGVGPRGYSPKGADSPTLVMTLHPAPVVSPGQPMRWELITSSFRIPAGDRLATFKTANKLAQVLARAEAEERGADEALLLNTDGRFAEAASSNLFWIENGVICTTPLAEGLLAGVTRAFALELAGQLGLPTAERSCRLWQLQQAEGVFLTNSSLEIVPAIALDGIPLRESPLTKELHFAYQRETIKQA
jgi:branched-chain amino acid aminotransferase